MTLTELIGPGPHQDPRADPPGPGHQAGPPGHSSGSVPYCPNVPLTLLCASSLAGFMGFVPPGQFLVSTGYLTATKWDLLDFSQMTPKKTSAAASSIAVIPNPASDTLTTPLCLPCIQGYPNSKHPKSCSVSVPKMQATGNPLSCPRADSALWGGCFPAHGPLPHLSQPAHAGRVAWLHELVNSPDHCPL